MFCVSFYLLHPVNFGGYILSLVSLMEIIFIIYSEISTCIFKYFFFSNHEFNRNSYLTTVFFFLQTSVIDII